MVALRCAPSRVRTGPRKPGKSSIFSMAFSRTAKSWKKVTSPEKFWKSVKLDLYIASAFASL